LAFPRYLHPFTWGAVWLIAEPVLYRTDPERSLFADIAAGSWGRIARLMAAGLCAGALWESFNAAARAKWIYTVPFLEHMKIFEMPPIGFLGFTFFALEVWSLYHLLAPRTRPRTVLPSVAVAALVLAGIDHWTVSSVTPRLGDLPGISNEVRGRLQDAGWTDVFRLARAPTAELAYRARITPAAAQAARQAARLSTLRGIGTRHAAALIAGGIASVEALAQADPDSVWRVAHHSARPTPAEEGVRIGLGVLYLIAGGDRHVGPDAEHLEERARALEPPARRDGPGRAGLRQVAEQVAGAREGAHLRYLPLEGRRVDLLDALLVLGRQAAAGFPRQPVEEQSAAHADAPVDAPDGQLDAPLLERLAPRQHMLVHAVHEGAVELEQEREVARGGRHRVACARGARASEGRVGPEPAPVRAIPAARGSCRGWAAGTRARAAASHPGQAASPARP